MKAPDIIRAVNLVAPSNRGISLEEQFKLKKLTPLRVSKNPHMNEKELAVMAVENIYEALGRRNVSPRDLKKAIIQHIEL